ncbi:MAG: hypothetical protein H6677_04240 [Candidatus Obscuribacterales bacterium]|nr:hypothetical protein [Cyanobacteria bacterium HKST-UBA01]MCB9467465.1 hypothetical protein [Candidatus Obscuribacterales bacterium]
MANIRVNESDKALLDSFCDQHKITHAEGFHFAMNLLKKDQFAKTVSAQFEALAANPEALSEYRQESALWEAVSEDGID